MTDLRPLKDLKVLVSRQPHIQSSFLWLMLTVSTMKSVAVVPRPLVGKAKVQVVYSDMIHDILASI